MNAKDSIRINEEGKAVHVCECGADQVLVEIQGPEIYNMFCPSCSTVETYEQHRVRCYGIKATSGGLSLYFSKTAELLKPEVLLPAFQSGEVKCVCIHCLEEVMLPLSAEEFECPRCKVWRRVFNPFLYSTRDEEAYND